MNDKFDDLTKGLAESVTRRGALKRFNIGLAVGVLGWLGLANQAGANQRKCLPPGATCRHNAGGGNRCCSGACTSDGESNTKYGYCL